MSPRDWTERIEDILVCAHNIQNFTRDMGPEKFLEDPRTSHAVAFEFTTMGEAARAMPADVQNAIQVFRGRKCKPFGMYWCTSIFASTRKFSGEQARRRFHP